MPAIQTDGGQILYRLFISYIRGPILFAMLSIPPVFIWYFNFTMTFIGV